MYLYLLRSGAKFQPSRLEMECNMTRTVYRSGVRYDRVHNVSQNDVSVKCEARNANDIVMKISIIRHNSIQLSLKMTFRQAISTLFSSNGLIMGALQQPGITEVLSKCSRSRFHLSYIEAIYVPDLSSLRTLVIVVVTDLFMNTRHHRRHLPLWNTRHRRRLL